MRTDLSFEDILALDRVQKDLPIRDDAIRRLRRAKLIEGRKPHLHVAAKVAAATGNKAEYIRTREQDDAHYAKLVLDYIDKFGSATRQEIDDLLWDKLSDALTDEERASKIANLLTKMRRSSEVTNAGSRKKPSWKRAE